MFDGLKKKFSKFISSVTKKEEEELTETQEISAQDSNSNQSSTTETKISTTYEIKKEKEVKHEKAKPEIHKTQEKNSFEQEKENKVIHINKVQEQEQKSKQPDSSNVQLKHENTQTISKKVEHTSNVNKTETIPEIKTDTKNEEKSFYQRQESSVPQKDSQNFKSQNITHNTKENEKQKEPKVSFGTKLRGVFSKEVSVKESDIEPFLEDLKISLLESDVNFDAAEKILDNIKIGLLSNKISSKNIDSQISDILKLSIKKILEKKSKIDLLELAKSKKSSGEPFKILFIGPNGAGKTTTMAKLANMFIKNSFSVVLSASDTFRAAAIEQTVIHAERLHIGVIKGKYGADPASVAFDAVAHAKAHHINVVLIDSAGRQETNKSLMEEIKKIVRITSPDIKIFVGESITGNSLLEQVSEFNKAVGLDGVILTKLDCDAKGGNTLSILSETSVPVIFFGVGEGYNDLMEYNPDFIIKNMVGG